MSTLPDVTPTGHRRWNRGAWLALAFALFLLAYNGILVWRALQVPADGWLVEGDYLSADPDVTFIAQVIGPPSPLQNGDRLIAIEGRSTAAMVASQFAWKLPPPPAWPDGTVLDYVVARDGRTIALSVPVYRYSFGQLLAAGLRWRGLPAWVQLAGSLFCFVVGVVVFLLRPRQRAAHALLILGVAFLFNAAPVSQWTTAYFYPFRPNSVPLDTWTMGINPSLMLIVLAFPTAKYPMRRFPRATILLLYLSAPLVIDVAYLLNLDHPAGFYATASVVYVAQVLLLLLLVAGSLVHSTLTLRAPVARSQLKWVGFGLASFVLPGVGGWLLGFLFTGLQNNLVYLVSVAGWFIMPICLAIAITRYRLFEIDVIIRRTLQYTLLTVLLALVYFGVVVVLQAIFRTTSGETSPATIVLSTLVIAALFAPLRRRVQTLIDRRFYRRKVTAEEALTRFATIARDEVDTDRLAVALLHLVEETMQPATVALWVKPAHPAPRDRPSP